MFRAAPKKRFRSLQGVGIHAAGEHLAGRRHDGVVGARQTGGVVQWDYGLVRVLHQALGLLDHVAGSWKVVPITPPRTEHCDANTQDSEWRCAMSTVHFMLPNFSGGLRLLYPTTWKS